jgi:hypothetical protein
MNGRTGVKQYVPRPIVAGQNIKAIMAGQLGIITYRHTLEHILVINLTNVIYAIKDLVGILTYRHSLNSLPHTCTSHYKVFSPVCVLMCICKWGFWLNHVIYAIKDLVGILTYRHTLEHILVINLTCDIQVCGKGFSRNSNLQTHID